MDVMVVSPQVAALTQLMPVKEPPDLSRFLLSPKPFWGQSRDLRVSVFGMYNQVTSGEEQIETLIDGEFQAPFYDLDGNPDTDGVRSMLKRTL